MNLPQLDQNKKILIFLAHDSRSQFADAYPLPCLVEHISPQDDLAALRALDLRENRHRPQRTTPNSSAAMSWGGSQEHRHPVPCKEKGFAN